MIVDPYGQLPILPGTRLLTTDFGLGGQQFDDPKEKNRVWTIWRLFCPIATRAIGGIRAKVVDNKGFISFMNQRDLELMLGYAKPGDWCKWARSHYPGVNDDVDGWYGLFCDEDDLRDDLHEFELVSRNQYAQYGYLPSGIEYKRDVHLDLEKDRTELFTFLWDRDPATGVGPDGRLETLERRWAVVERRNVNWQKI